MVQAAHGVRSRSWGGRRVGAARWPSYDASERGILSAVHINFNKKVPFLTTFQSRFGPEEWLTPYTEETLVSLAKTNTKNVLIICSGFSSDCIETLEEINLRAKEVFLKNGGKNFLMVPCLNDNNDHIKLLAALVKKYYHE